jgi:hypothetical protein
MQLRDKAFETGCTGVLSIPVDTNDPNSKVYHLCEHPDIPIETVLTHVETYINEPCRDAQNSYLVYKMIMNSLTEEARRILCLDEEPYMTRTDAGPIRDGALLFKVIYAKAGPIAVRYHK